MKVTVVLVLVSVAFTGALPVHRTGSLVSQARPFLAQIGVSGRETASDSLVSKSLQQQLEALVNEVDQAIQNGQELTANVVQLLQHTQAQFEALDGQAADQALNILRNFFETLAGYLQGNAFAGAKQLVSEKLSLPSALNQLVQDALQGHLTTDQYNTLISQLSPVPGTEALVLQLVDLMLEAGKPKARAVPAHLQPNIQQALQGLLSSDQYNTLISQLSPVVGTEALVLQLVDLMLVAATPKVARVVPATLERSVQQGLQAQLSSDQYNTLISQLSPIPGTEALVLQLVDLMLAVSKPKMARAVPAILQSSVQQGLQGHLTSDQYNTLISQLSPIAGTESLVLQFVDLMLESAIPKLARSIPAQLQTTIQNGLQAQLSTDQYNTLISQLSPVPGTEALVLQLVDLMLEAGKPKVRAIPAHLQPNIQQALQGLLSSDQYNTLISQLSPVVGTEALVLQLVDLMLVSATPRMDRSVPTSLNAVLQQALQGLLTSDQYNTLISQLSPILGTESVVIQLVQLMLQSAKPQSPGRSVLTNLLLSGPGIVQSFVGNSVTAIQSLAQQALLTATQTGNAMVDQASQSLLNAVTPFQNMLGDAYEELINILSGINSSHFQI